jgi:membrane fusion protein (multidrug efflux system)
VLTQISKTEINAPFGGHIGFRYVSPGGYVSSATLVARLQQTNPVKLEFAIPEK